MTRAQYRSTRIRCGLTQQQLADALGVSRLSILRRENGKVPITIEMRYALQRLEQLCKLRKALGLEE